MTDTIETTATVSEASGTENGAVLFVPLNKLKKSPRNARKTPHSEAHIEALAASIAAKGMLQNLVVEPETNADGEPIGFYFVTIGEGRRLAQLLRVKRKQIKKTEAIRCVLDTENDATEISLDENVTREAMHPADQFERFRELAENRGWGAEEIAARFGVTAHVVRQRLRLEDTPAAKALADRHAGWASDMPRDVVDLWAFVAGLDYASLMALLANCAALTVNAVRIPWEQKPNARAMAETLASAVMIDMTAHWTPTVRTYLGRVTKAHILNVVREAVGHDAAERITGLKKPEMAQAAEQLLAGTGWLPSVLRTAPPASRDAVSEAEPFAQAAK